MSSIVPAECRLCLNRMYNMRNIILNPISSDFNLSIPESIAVFFDIKIDRNDKYSKLVCANCLSVIQLMHIHRKRFQHSQESLRPIVKEEDSDPVKNDDDPPVLEPFFESNFHEEGIQANNHRTSSQVTGSSHCSTTEQTIIRETDYIKIPKIFFEDTKSPKVEIKSKEMNLANLALYGNNAESRTGKRCNRIRRKYLKHAYNEGRPGVIRELIQDQVRRSLYISHFDNDNRFKSIYEYDINLKQNRVNEYDEKLWKIGMQLSVFVCTMCNKVFYSKTQLDTHQKIHKKFQEKMNIWKVIF